MKGAAFKEKVSQSIEKMTIDRLINTERKTENEFISDLWNVGEHDEFINALKEKVEAEQKLYEEALQREELQKEKEGLYKSEENENSEDLESSEGSEDKEKGEGDSEGDEQTDLVEKAIIKPVVSAEEIRPELVEYIRSELMEKMQAERSNVITEFINGRSVSQEEFYKLQLWSYFPVLGIPIYFFFLMALSINRTGKYAVTIQNYAKVQLRTFWIYLVAHTSVLFVAGASMTSLINIIQRGLGA